MEMKEKNDNERDMLATAVMEVNAVHDVHCFGFQRKQWSLARAPRKRGGRVR
jgi:hypothetical protein